MLGGYNKHNTLYCKNCRNEKCRLDTCSPEYREFYNNYLKIESELSNTLSQVKEILVPNQLNNF